MKLSATCLASCVLLVRAQDVSLYETVAATADLSTLASAIDLAGLQDYFTTTTDLTLFAPSNTALQLLPAKFLTPGFTPHLIYLLNYHVVQGSVLMAATITDGMDITMVNGESISAAVSDEGALLSGAAFSDSKIVTPDIMASNNTIAHMVDQYFLPEALTLTLFDLTGQAPGFSSVLDLVLQSGLESELTAENRTVLAPSDAAFSALPADYLDEVSANPELRDSILLYHVIIGSYPQEIIVDGMEVMTASGQSLKFGVIGDGRFAVYSAIGPSNNVTLEIKNLFAANGCAHSISAVLEAPPLATTPIIPVPTVVSPTIPVPTAPPLSIPTPIATPVTIPVTTPAPLIITTLAPFTVTAPLPLPSPVAVTMGPVQTGALSIYDTIALTSDLSTLSTAISAVGLVEFFDTTMDLTVFLPINAAFRTLPKKYLTPGFIPHLKSIVNFHVVQSGVVPGASIQDGVTINMLNGESILPTINDTSILINGAAFSNARVIISDLSRTNGYAYVVNQYFLPEVLTLTLFDLTRQVPGFASFLDLILQSGLESEVKANDRTLLVPSDTVFSALPADYLAKLSTDAKLRDSIILYHVVIGSYPQEILVNGMKVMTASGNALKFGVVGDGEMAQYSAVGPFNNATFVDSNLIASNGLLHSIDAVLEAPLLVIAPTIPVPTFPPSDILSGPPLGAPISTTSSPLTPSPATAPPPTSQSLPTNTTEPPIGPPPFAEPTESSSGAWTIGGAMTLVFSVFATLS